MEAAFVNLAGWGSQSGEDLAGADARKDRVFRLRTPSGEKDDGRSGSLFEIARTEKDCLR